MAIALLLQEIINLKNKQDDNTKSLFEAILARIDNDLKTLQDSFFDIIHKVKRKAKEMIDSTKEKYKLNFDGLKEYCDQIAEGPDNKADKIENLNFLKERLIADNLKIPLYTSYNDETHSFNQVISIMKKAFDLFDEHFLDLLSFPKPDDFSDFKQLNREYQLKKFDLLEDRTIAVMKKSKFKLVFEGEINTYHEKLVNALSLINDDIILTASLDRTLHIISRKEKKVLNALTEMKFSPMALCLLKTGGPNDKKQNKSNSSQSDQYSFLATGGGDADPNISIWSLETSRKILNLPGHTRNITTIVQFPDYNFIASGGYDSKIFIWDLIAAEPKLILSKHSFWIFKVGISPCNTKFVSCSWDRNILIWKIIYDSENKNSYSFRDLVLERILQDRVEVLTFNFSIYNPNLLFTTNIGRTLKIWDMKDGTAKKEIVLTNEEGFFSNDILIVECPNEKQTKIIVMGIEKSCIRVYDAETTELEQILEHDLIKITAFNVNPKLNFFKFDNGEFGLVCINHSNENTKLGVVRLKNTC